MSNTPQFDKALDEYFAKLELDKNGGQWRTCRFSGEKFYVRPEDVEFYKRIRVPLPVLSPTERARKKIAFSNSYNFFKVTSALSGKQIISQYPPSTRFKVYEHEIWFGEWDSLEYGQAYRSEVGFFKQFRELQTKVPRPNLWVDNTSVNSDYTNNSSRLKNCYLIFDAWQVEDSAYGIAHLNSRNVFDSFTLVNSDTCYDCFEGSDLWHCFYVEHSRNCRESYFLFDCRDCDYCFGCTNLRHKKYYFFNEPLTKEEYEKRIQGLNLGDREVLESIKERFAELKKNAIYKENHNQRDINSFGDYLHGAKNCYACFYMVQSENLAFCIGGVKIRDSYDVFGGVGSESCYDSYGGEQNYGNKFSFGVEFSRNMEYCDLCLNSHDCFGCVGLKNKSFCIFNKQYSEDEYWQEVDRIKTKMLQDGEYGEFFSPEISPYPYNISLATSYLGYDDIKTAKQYGYVVEDIEEVVQEVGGEKIEAKDLPRDIKEAKDEILQKVIFDSEHNKFFKYIRPELDFYKTHNIPLPQHHPYERLAEKRKRLGSIIIKTYNRPCAKCGKMMQTTYAPSRPEKNIWCEECYLKEIV